MRRRRPFQDLPVLLNLAASSEPPLAFKAFIAWIIDELEGSVPAI